MKLLMVGLSHKTAPLDIREALALDKEGLKAAYDGLKSGGELLLLSTCNRMEAYVTLSGDGQEEPRLRRFLEGLKPAKSAQVKKALVALTGEHALWHLMKVAASLDSMVLGEAQILGQVKQAYEGARAAGTLGPTFHGLFQRIFAAAKEVRTRTELGRHPASVPSVAVQLAERIFGDLSGRTALLVGAGEVAELTAEHLKSAGIKRLLVCNRSQARAKELAKRFAAEVHGLEELARVVPQADVAVFSASSQEWMLGRPEAEAALALRQEAPQLYIDLGVPRNVDPSVKGLEPAYLYNVDDLQALAEEHRERRLDASRDAEEILKKHLAGIKEWMAASQMGPSIKAFAARVEAMRKAEWERLGPKLRHLSPEDLEKVEYLTQALSKKFADQPIRKLKDSAKGGRAALHLQALSELFGFKEED